MAVLVGTVEERGRIDLLVDVVRRLAATRTLDQVVDIVRHAARELSGADGATFVLRDGDRCRYVDEDAIEPLWKGHTFPLEACISGWAMLHRLPVVIEDIYADDRVPHDAYRPTFVQSLVMIPIRTEEPLGAIGAYWATARSATPDEVALLQALADSTSVALENVRLYSELEARVEARTAALAHANDELRQLTAAVAHDIRSPLFAVEAYAEVLASRHADGMTDDARTAATGLRRSVHKLSDFVAELLDYLVTGNGDMRVVAIDVRDLYAEVLERVSADVAVREATVRLEGATTLTGDRALLGRLLQNLLSNAITYTPDDRAPDITVRVRDAGEWSELSVIDNGDGIPVDERERVFAPFERGTTAARRPGSGLGLAMCRRIAEQHAGDLDVRDADGGGAELVLRIPRRAA